MSIGFGFVQEMNPGAMEEQAAFIQEGLIERDRLKQENAELQTRALQFIKSEYVEKLLKPFQDHSGRSDAEIQIKYHQVLSDIDQTRVDISALEARAEQEQMVLKTSFEEAQQKAEELLVQFQVLREAAGSIQVPAFGIQLTNQQITEMEHQFQEQLTSTEVKRLEYIQAQEKYKQLEQKTKKQNEHHDRNNIIDYEQLKIQNQSLAEKIEERSEELLKLRRRTVSTLQILAHVREKKHFVENQVNELQRQQTSLDDKITNWRNELGRLKIEKNKIRLQMDQSRDSTGLSGNETLRRDYETRQKLVEGLHIQMAKLKEEYDNLCDELIQIKTQRQNALQ